ncbi:alpha/beta fold hydrolase [Pseudomonas brenneri]
MWDTQMPAFTEHFRVLRLDTRGHGKSLVTAGPYSIEQLGRDVLALLDALNIERAHFCGLSMGGLIGQWLGINAGERLLKLVVCNTAAKIGTRTSGTLASKWSCAMALRPWRHCVMRRLRAGSRLILPRLIPNRPSGLPTCSPRQIRQVMPPTVARCAMLICVSKYRRSPCRPW